MAVMLGGLSAVATELPKEEKEILAKKEKREVVKKKAEQLQREGKAEEAMALVLNAVDEAVAGEQEPSLADQKMEEEQKKAMILYYMFMLEYV